MARNILLKEYLQNEVRMRYAPKSILPYDDNEALHRLLDPDGSNFDRNKAKDLKIMNNNIIQMSNSLMTHTDAEFNIDPESFTNRITRTLLDELDIKPTAEDLQKIKNKGVKLCVVGYGGAMINMLYNMYLWSMELSVTRPFEKLVIFEKDTLDFSNIPRLGKTIAHQYHPDFIQYFDEKIPNIKTLNKTFLLDVEAQLCKNQKPIIFQDWVGEVEASKIDAKGYVMVGAPTLEARTILQDKNFYFMGHGDFEVEITKQPVISSGLVTETYGSIDIPALLINLQLATAAFIKILAGDDEHAQNEKLFSFDIKSYLEEKGELHV